MKVKVNGLRLLRVNTFKSKADKDVTVAEFGDERDFTKISVFVPEEVADMIFFQKGNYYDVVLDIQLINYKNSIVLEEIADGTNAS